LGLGPVSTQVYALNSPSLTLRAAELAELDQGELGRP